MSATAWSYSRYFAYFDSFKVLTNRQCEKVAAFSCIDYFLHFGIWMNLCFFNSSGPTCSLMSGGTLLASVCAPYTWKWSTHPSRDQQRSGDQSQSTSCIRNVSENRRYWCSHRRNFVIILTSKCNISHKRKSLLSLFCFHTEYKISSSLGQWISASTGPHMTSLPLSGRLTWMTWDTITQSALLLNQWPGEPLVWLLDWNLFQTC